MKTKVNSSKKMSSLSRRYLQKTFALSYFLLSCLIVFGQGGGTNPVSCPDFSVDAQTVTAASCDVVNIPTNCFATDYVSFQQGPTSNDGEVSPERSNPNKALGAPQFNDTENFFSLGFGGWIILKFGSPILNGPGDDILLVETTFGNNQNCNSYRERAELFASQDGVTFYSLGTTCLDGTFDLDNAVDSLGNPVVLANAKYFKIVDRSNPADFGFGDAYDVDGLVCLNGSVASSPTGTGAIELALNGGVGPFIYNWSNGDVSPALSNIPGGIYNVTVTDSRNCSATTTVTVDKPDPIELSFAGTNVGCAGSNNGSITVNVTGGTPGYTYNWTSGQNVSTINSVGAGIYSVIVTDSKGCQEFGQYTLGTNNPSVNSYSFVSTNESCLGANDGGVELIINNQCYAQPITFLWSNGSTTQNLTNVGEGDYEVQITDANGGKDLAGEFPVKATSRIAVSIVETNDVTCFGGSDGSATVAASGCMPSYTFSIPSQSNNTGVFSNLAKGKYFVTVTDANNIAAIDSFVISEPVRFQVGIVEGSCELSGTILQGGNAPYTYSWERLQSTFTASGETIYLSGPSNGLYRITVTDDNGCSATAFRSVQSFSNCVITCNLSLTPSVTDVSCFGGNNGSVIITPTGATGNINYSYSNNVDPQTLTFGQYSVSATDAKGCTASATFVVNQPSELSVNINKVDPTQAVTCSTVTASTLGSASAVVTGGNGGYQYVWSNGATTSSVTGLSDGNYSVTVYDSKQCVANKQTTLTLQSTNTPCNTGGCYAVDYKEFNQGQGKIGSVLPRRSDPINALGEPQNDNTVNFVSLGFGGSIVLEFAQPIADGPGNDIRLWETSYNRNTPNIVNSNSNACNSYPERAQVFASYNGLDYVYLGETCLDGEFDLDGSGLCAAKYIKIVDISRKARFGNSLESDGFDIDAIECLNGTSTCVPTLEACVTRYVSSFQGPTSVVGKNIQPSRSVPSNGLTPQNNLSRFYALGFGGEYVIKFDYVIFDNGIGTDFTVVEATSAGSRYDYPNYPETAIIYGSKDGSNWVVLDTAYQDARIDLNKSGTDFIQYVKVKDISDMAAFANVGHVADGYDLDGFVCGNGPWASIRGTEVEEDELLLSINDVVTGKLIANVQPNPFQNNISVIFNEAFFGEDVTVTIFNTLGQVAIKEDFLVNTNEKLFNLDGYADGTYLVKISSTKYTKIIKVLKTIR